MAGGSEEARFAEIDAFCMPLGALQHRLRTLALGDVVDRHQDLPHRKRFPADLPAIQPQYPPAECRQIEEVPEARNVQATVADCDEVPADRLDTRDRKDAVESLVRGDNAQLFVEDDQRLSNGVDDAVQVRTSALGIVNMQGRRHGRAPPALSLMTSCRHTGVPLSTAVNLSSRSENTCNG